MPNTMLESPTLWQPSGALRGGPERKEAYIRADYAALVALAKRGGKRASEDG
jgi:hypothetical protein